MSLTQGSWIATINCLDAANNPTALYFSDDGYKDSLGRYYQARMKQPAKINISGNDGGLLGVMKQASIGEIELDNTDGGLDYLADYKLDGRECTLQLVTGTKITTWLKGIITRLNQQNNSIFVTLKSLTEALDSPLNLARYAGSGGVEGLTTDVMGNVKPRVYGTVLNATPVLCFATSGVYQVSDLTTTTVTAVYDKGVVITLGTTHTSLANLLATTPAAGTFDRFQGYFRLGTMSVQQITCSATDTLTAAGDVFKHVASGIQFSSGQRLINEQPVLLNDTLHYYQLSNVTSTKSPITINNVYNDNAPVTYGGTYASLSEMQTTAPALGTWKSFNGYFRINLSSYGAITYDAYDNKNQVSMLASNSFESTDTGARIYCVSSNTTAIQAFKITDVFNDGTPLKFGVERTTNDLATVAPAVGTYDTYNGYFRINPPLQSTPNPTTGAYDPILLGTVTANATDLSVTYSTTYTVKVNETPVTGAVAVLNQCGNIGLYINSDVTIRSVLDEIVKSVGGFWWFGDATSSTNYNSNLLNVALYEAPASTPDIEIKDYQITSAERAATSVGNNGLPFYSVVAKYNKVETQQSDVLGATLDAWRARVLKGHIIKESADLTVKSIHPQSLRLTFDSALKSDTAMATVTDRLLLQFKNRCDIVSVTCYFSNLPKLSLNQTVRVYYNRLGYKNGVSMRLIGYELDIKRKSVTMQLMGYKL